MSINFADYAEPHERTVIREGTTHSLFSKIACMVLVRAVSSQMKGPLPFQARQKMEQAIASAISRIDDFAFRGSIQEKEAHIDHHLNRIAVSAIEAFRGHAQ